MDKQQRTACLAITVVLVGAGYAVWKGKIPAVTLDPRSIQGAQYDPFIHWRVHEGAGWYHHPHPGSIAPNTLPDGLQNVSIGKAVEQIEVIDGASCAQ